MSADQKSGRMPIWSGRPAVGGYVALYGMVSAVVGIVLVVLELLFANTSLGGMVLVRSVSLGGVSIPYPVELLTAVVVLLVFLAKALGLSVLRAKTKYALYEDGLYIDLGIVNLENIFVAPMAFSDARLYRSWGMRMMKKGTIMIDTNDGRHFELKLIEHPLDVQSIIRSTLSRPTFRMQP